MRGNKKVHSVFQRSARLWSDAGRDAKKLQEAWQRIWTEAEPLARKQPRAVMVEALRNAGKLDVPNFAPAKTPNPTLLLLERTAVKLDGKLLTTLTEIGRRIESPRQRLACLTLLATRVDDPREVLRRLPVPADPRFESLITDENAPTLCALFEKNLLTRWPVPLDEGLFYRQDTKPCVMAHPMLLAKRIFETFGKSNLERARDYIDLLLNAPDEKLSHTWLSDVAKLHVAVGSLILRTLATTIANIVADREFLDIGSYHARVSAESLTSPLAKSVVRGMLLSGSVVMTPELAELYIEAGAPACVDALWLSDTPNRIAALGMIKAKSRDPNVARRAAEALRQIAEESKISPEHVDDLAVDPCGLDASGRRAWKAGGYTLALQISKTGAPAVHTYSASNHRLPRPPKTIETSTEMAEAAQLSRRLGQILAKQRARLEDAMIARRSWSLATWQTVFLNHPIMRNLAARVVWTWKEQVRTIHAVYNAEAGRFEDTRGRALTPTGELMLAHPAHMELRETHDWQTWLVLKSNVQPFNQLFREVYLPALNESHETETLRWSGMAALHETATNVLRARGWEGGVVGLEWDGSEEERFYHRDFNCGLRAVADIEPMIPSTPLQITLKGLAFYPIPKRSEKTHSAPPVPLSQVPTVVFSEAARDLDYLTRYVGAADRALWRYCQQEGDPEPRFYAAVIGWYERVHSEMAEANRQYLEALAARLKIADRVSFTGRFASIHGKLARYRVHLGTGHAYVEPHGPLLTVPAGGEPLEYAPFEAPDESLAALVGRILTLVEDSKIEDSKFRESVLACVSTEAAA